MFAKLDKSVKKLISVIKIVGFPFGMPLNAEYGQRFMLYRLRYTVFRTGGDAKAVRNGAYRLVVVAVDGKAFAVKIKNIGAFYGCHFVECRLAVRGMNGVSFNILYQCSAEEYVYQLNAAADTEYGLFCVKKRFQKLKFRFVTF